MPVLDEVDAEDEAEDEAETEQQSLAAQLSLNVSGASTAATAAIRRVSMAVLKEHRQERRWTVSRRVAAILSLRRCPSACAPPAVGGQLGTRAVLGGQFCTPARKPLPSNRDENIAT